jgi:hypothetical protein
MGKTGHQPPLRFLLQTGRSTWAVLQSRRSISANDFVELNFGCAAGTANGCARTYYGTRP